MKKIYWGVFVCFVIMSMVLDVLWITELIEEIWPRIGFLAIMLILVAHNNKIVKASIAESRVNIDETDEEITSGGKKIFGEKLKVILPYIAIFICLITHLIALVRTMLIT